MSTSYKKECQKVYPALFCQRGTYSGWSIWLRGPAIRISGGKTPALAWKNAHSYLFKNKDRIPASMQVHLI